MAEGIQIKNLPSTITIKQGDTMTIVQDKQNKQLALDVFANESDLATLSPLENRCDEVKAKIEVDEYSAEITTSQSMSEIGSDDNGADLHENVLDGAYESCVLKGKTKYIDNDTQEILDTFQDGRNLSLIDVKSPILTNLDANNEQSNTVTFDQKDGKTIVLRSLPDGICDTLNVETGEYVQRIGEIVLDGNSTFSSVTIQENGVRVQYNNANKKNGTSIPVISDKFKFVSYSNTNMPFTVFCGNNFDIYFMLPLNSNVTTIADAKNWFNENNTIIQFPLTTETIKTVGLSGYPFSYENGHIQLSSGSTEPSLTPTITYKVPVSRVGQIASNTKSNLRQTIKLDQLEILAYQSLINAEYENLLVQNSAESAASFTNLSTNDPKDELYYMLKHLIEEDQPVQNMLDKINLFYLYGLLSDEHYFDLLLGGEEGVY